MFNVADSAIVVGVALLALNALSPSRPIDKPRTLEMPAADRRRRAPLRARSRDLANSRVVIVPPFAAGDRLDGFLQRHGGEQDRSRAEWQRLIGLEAVLLNGYVSKPSERVVAGDRVSIATGVVSRPGVPTPEDEVPFTVVFEDPSMIVLDKPAVWWSTRRLATSAARWSMAWSRAFRSCAPWMATCGRASSTASTRTPAGCW